MGYFQSCKLVIMPYCITISYCVTLNEVRDLEVHDNFGIYMQLDKRCCIQLNAEVYICGETMTENYNMFDKLGGNIQKKKIEKAIEMLRNESPQELRRKLGSFDTNELLEKIDEFDMRKLGQMGISVDDLKGALTERDYEKAAQVLGPEGAAIIKKIKAMLK